MCVFACVPLCLRACGDAFSTLGDCEHFVHIKAKFLRGQWFMDPLHPKPQEETPPRPAVPPSLAPRNGAHKGRGPEEGADLLSPS